MKNKLYLLLFLTPFVGSGSAHAARAGEGIHSETSINDLQSVAVKVYKVLIFFLPAVATLYLILSGYRYIIAQGNPDLVEKAKKSLTYAVLGVIISYVSVAVIATIAKQLGLSPGFGT